LTWRKRTAGAGCNAGGLIVSDSVMCDELDLHLGRRLRRRRRFLGLSQSCLGQACGVRFQQIQKYECAANRMTAVMLWKLATALEVEVGYFYEGFERPAAKANDPWPATTSLRA
jgi:hypothetical protein